MKLLNNRRFALAVLVVCILGSVVGLGGASLARQRSDVLRVFNDGIDDSFAVRFSMDAYLESCAEYARTMAEEYRLHVGEENASAAQMLEIAGRIGDGDDLDARYSDYLALCAAVESLYTDFYAANVSEADSVLFGRAYADFQGEVSKIGYDEYHVLAEKFNRSLDGFPAGAVSGLLGIDTVHPFR